MLMDRKVNNIDIKMANFKETFTRHAILLIMFQAIFFSVMESGWNTLILRNIDAKSRRTPSIALVTDITDGQIVVY